jgi:Na+-transporting NADH:ubiquinone oxidoreductase subunit A
LIVPKNIRIKEGLNIPVAGRPVQEIHGGPQLGHVALCGPDYIGLKPRMLVAEGDTVELAQPLFVNKHHPEVPYCSPGKGTVSAINRGPRRALHSVVIRLHGEATGEERYKPMAQGRVAGLHHEEVAGRLRETGLWTAFRKRPFSRVPGAEEVPRSIFVTAIDTRPLAADPLVVARQDAERLADGLRVLPLLTDGPVFLCTGPGWDIPAPESDRIRHVTFSGPHPAGLAGTHIHHLDPAGTSRSVWHIGYQDVIAIGRLFAEGWLETARVVALGGSCVKQPRLVKARIGASIHELTDGCMDHCQGYRVISGSVLGGRAATSGLAFLGRYHEQVSAIPEGGDRHLFGWTGVFPWRYSATRTFLRKAGHKRRHNITTAQNGRFSGMIPTRAFEKVLPMDILPSPLFRALLVRDTDQAQALGCLELDEEDLALCSFVCPAKVDYGAALRINLQQIEKEG